MSTKRQGRPAARQGKPGAGVVRGGAGPRQPGGKQGPPPKGRQRTPPGTRPAKQGQPGAKQGRPGAAAGKAGASRAETGTRAAIERRSALPLVFLRQMPGWTVPLLMAGLLVAGLALRGWPGAAVLVLLAVFIGWLGFLSWPVLTPSGRAARVLMAAVPLLIAGLQAGR